MKEGSRPNESKEARKDDSVELWCCKTDEKKLGLLLLCSFRASTGLFACGRYSLPS
jgi:hypothetical protein